MPKSRSGFFILFLICVLDLFLWRRVLSAAGPKPGDYFLDVGQGDAELIVLPGGARMLVDAGPPNGKVIAALQKILAGNNYIDLALNTHPQLDHFGGFGALLDSFDVGTFLWNGRDDDPGVAEWPALVEKIHARHLAMVPIGRGDAIRSGDADVRVLSPDALAAQSAELNDTGLVTLVETPRLRTLLTADIGANIETYLLGREAGALRADVLKVPHHGSKYSSSEAFLRAVNPKAAVIEVGAQNVYGHPAKEALARLASSTRAEIFRTDRDGTVEIWNAGDILRAAAGK